MDLFAPARLKTAGRHVLATPTVTLRPLRGSDAAALVRGLGNYDVAKWLAEVPYPFGAADAERFLASADAGPGRAWAICDAEGVQGVIALGSELGFWLARPVWGRGYLFDAAQAAIGYHFRAWRAPDLVARHFVQNERSARVLIRLRFEPEGLAPCKSLPLNQVLPSRTLRLTRQRWHGMARAA